MNPNTLYCKRPSAVSSAGSGLGVPLGSGGYLDTLQTTIPHK